jgi:hypothetical protein
MVVRFRSEPFQFQCKFILSYAMRYHGRFHGARRPSAEMAGASRSTSAPPATSCAAVGSLRQRESVVRVPRALAASRQDLQRRGDHAAPRARTVLPEGCRIPPRRCNWPPLPAWPGRHKPPSSAPTHKCRKSSRRGWRQLRCDVLLFPDRPFISLMRGCYRLRGSSSAAPATAVYGCLPEIASW